MLPATSKTAPRSRKRTRSHSNASSSVEWNPEWESDGDSNNNEKSDAPDPQLPSSINVFICSDVALENGSADIDDENETNPEQFAPDKSYAKPPEQVRYQMLGAPTLLYRHAPSYLDPSCRPSTLTPQQLSLALYMNDHPIKDWLTDRHSQELKNAHPATTKSPFLNSTHVPQPPRPWGRPHDWDWRHGRVPSSSKFKAVRDIRRQAELNAHILVGKLHGSNREKVRGFWEDVKRRNRSEKQYSKFLPPRNTQRRRNMKGFNVFCSEYINQFKQSLADRTASPDPRHHFQIACKAWNEMPEEKQVIYDNKAERIDQTLENQNHPVTREDEDDEIGSHWKPMQKKSLKGRTSRTTGFNIFRSEYIQANPLTANTSADDRKVYLTKISAHWKNLSEKMKTAYRQKAKEESKIRPIRRPKELKQKRTRKGKVTGFNIFLSQYLRSNALAAYATHGKRKFIMKASKIAGNRWKEMLEEERSVYKDMAREKNECRPEQCETSGDAEAQLRNANQEQEDLSHKNTGKTTGFHIFRSEYTLRWKEANPNSSAADRQVAMIKCCKEASVDWNKMLPGQRSVYQQKAKAENDNRDNESLTELKLKHKAGRKGITTGFNIFRSEAMIRLRQSNPLPDGASAAEREAYFKKFTRIVSADWKEMSEAEKSRYRQNAEKRNELPLSGNARDLEDNLESDFYDSISGSGDATSGDAAFYIPNQHNRFPGQPIAEQHEPENLSPEFESTDVQALHDECSTSSRARLESCPDYFSPFGQHDVNFGFGLEGMESLPLQHRGSGSDDDKSDDSQDPVITEVPYINNGCTKTVEEDRLDLCEDRDGVGGPSGHGNCLITIPCRCQFCEHQSCSWFLIHPAGDYMSCVATSKLFLPRDSSRHSSHQVRQKVDVGGRILQIAQCGVAVSCLKPSNQKLCLVARTSQYCSVIYTKATIKASPRADKCPIGIAMWETTRVDLRAHVRSSQPSYLPVHVTCDPRSVSSFTCPSFAILSRDYFGNCTTIHQVAMREEPALKSCSLLSSLGDVSLIEFAPNDRLVLLAAARARAMPKLSSGFFEARSGIVTGYGHSLFRIDLRSSSSSLLWSPSHAEYVTEGLHSISGIMPDATHEHLVWVSSSSASKVWALDVQYKSAVVAVDWSLPSLCDDFGSHMAVTGVFGGGVLLSQPVPSASPKDDSACQEVRRPMFSVKKDPNSHVVGVHQFPSATPRFQAKSLESAGFQEVAKLKHNVYSIARSAIFPLPDVSSSIFNIGLASLQCSSKSAMTEKQLAQLGCLVPPTNVTYVVTMTSLGDIYCHTLLETNAMEESQARQFPGLPVGTKAVPVPPGNEEKLTRAQFHMKISLCNEFPIPSSAITPYVFNDVDECCSFRTFDIGSILSAKRVNTSVDGLIELNKAMKPHDEKINTFRVASNSPPDDEEEPTINLVSNLKRRAFIHHSLPRFTVAPENIVAPIKRQNQQISLPCSFMVVAIKESNDAVDACNAYKVDGAVRPSEEVDEDFINKLKSNYGLIDAKSECSIDSE